MEVSGAREHRARARPKKRAKQRMVTVEVSDSSVEKLVALIVNTSEVANNELGKLEMRSEESQRRMQKAEDAYRQLREDSTDVLRLQLEKCLNGFAM
ncbi:hypothetical protein AXG93_3678s1080 [Marchantia polymorpha subsp. ruderalis]|uniref:Uncharacterized protein n=1 Tax=Marchantia polymorpha subsp. ruderalis TaxID=1480154 RepID=A0A176W964_MARPO|nr:hypothetical protein AXG93_3678s1080 [Marchantia polymorpha subsp. ruderalis]